MSMMFLQTSVGICKASDRERSRLVSGGNGFCMVTRDGVDRNSKRGGRERGEQSSWRRKGGFQLPHGARGIHVCYRILI